MRLYDRLYYQEYSRLSSHYQALNYQGLVTIKWSNHSI
ncbi:hypothetical protein AO367_1299 [Moraxella catarrhalis]|nr:hypothetical protein AO380_0629 [Moraxella catarrhalis]OAV30288.1 hypothetical protein AO367_1299 [Moraxella catarrhalis]